MPALPVKAAATTCRLAWAARTPPRRGQEGLGYYETIAGGSGAGPHGTAHPASSEQASVATPGRLVDFDSCHMTNTRITTRRSWSADTQSSCGKFGCTARITADRARMSAGTVCGARPRVLGTDPGFASDDGDHVRRTVLQGVKTAAWVSTHGTKRAERARCGRSTWRQGHRPDGNGRQAHAAYARRRRMGKSSRQERGAQGGREGHVGS